MKAALAALCLVVCVVSPAQAQLAPEAKGALQQYYKEYLSKVSWGPPTEATTFKLFYLGQPLTVGDGTPFLVCKAMKDINGENECEASVDFRRFVCPFTPPFITCTGFGMSSNMFSAEERDATLSVALTAFGNKVRPSVQIALDDWFPDTPGRRMSGRVVGIIIKAEAPSADFVPTAVDHFTRTTGQRPEITVDEKDKDIISRQCKLNIDKLYAGRAKSASEVADAMNKCETDSLEKFFISTTRSLYYVWNTSGSGLPQNKAVSMAVHRDLVGSRVVIEMIYKSGEAEREFKAKVDAFAAAAKAAKDKRNKDDF